MPTVDPIGTRLRNRRNELGLTMEQVAERAGVDQGTVSRLEAGKMPRVAFGVICKVARRSLGMSLDELADLAVEADEEASIESRLPAAV